MEIEESTYEATPLVTVHGDVDHYSFPDFAVVTNAIFDRGKERLAVDLRDCPYMDSAGISVLFSTLSRVPLGGYLAVITVDPSLARVFGIVGLLTAERFHLLSSPEELAAVTERMRLGR